MLLQDVVEHIADVTSAVDPTNAQQVLGKFSALSSDFIQKRATSARRMWEIGVLLATNKTKLTSVDLGRTFGIRREELTKAKRVAKILDCDDKTYEKRYEMHGRPSWNAFCHYILPPGPTVNKSNQKTERWQAEVSAEMANLNDPALRERSLNLLQWFQRKLSRVIPIKTALDDINYLPYSQCACCGEYNPPPEGHKLIKFRNTLLKVPQCIACEEAGREPDAEEVAVLYGNYALNLEYLMNKLEDYQ